jgi:uncharacterized protein with gpF-like domain
MVVVDPESRTDRLIAQAEARFRAEFLAVVELIRNDRTLAELADLLDRGRIDEALAITSPAATRLGSAWNDIYTTSGQSTANFLSRRVDGVLVEFDRIDSRTITAMRENSLRLVREFSLEQRRVANQVLINGINNGDSPRELARAFRNSIGLTQRQAQFIASYRSQLENLERTALRRALRDQRFDRTVERAIADRTPLTQGRVNQLVDRYQQRLVTFRAETIAQTEALAAVQEGNAALYLQAITSRDLEPNQVMRVWHTRGDERVRGSHAPMDGQQRPFAVPFTSGAGNSLDHPGDFRAPASERIRCRCGLSTLILEPTAALAQAL